MGLDTVELIIEVEEGFNITLDDYEASRTVTVGDLARSVYLKKVINSENKDIFHELYFKLKSIFIKLGVKEETICDNAELIEIIPSGEFSKYKNCIEEETGLKVPKNFKLNYHPSSELEPVRLMGVKIYNKKRRIRDLTVGQLTDCIISQNYKELIDLQKIHNLYEVERVICKITSDKCGIDIHEIQLYHSIVKDLGLD